MFDSPFALAILPQLGRAAVTTFLATLASFGLALILGLPIMLLRRSRRRWLASAVGVFSDFIRSTPLLVQLFFLYFAAPEIGIVLPPLITGILAFALHFGCYMAEVYRAGYEAVPRGQWDACRALGLTRRLALRLVILPQAIRPMVPAAGNYLVHLFKETPLLASISAAEMMFVASEIGSERFRYLEPITLCGLLFLAMSLVAGASIRLVERRLARPG